MTRSRILIAEDQPEVADQIEQLLLADFDVIGVFPDGVALVEASRSLAPDVVVTDIAMPNLNGLDAVHQVRVLHPDVRVVYVSVHDDPSLVERALRAGPCAYVLKSDAGEDLIRAVRAVLRGETFLSDSIAQADRRATP
ncbi:response regulator [Novilysobacter selenitireducens]|uniref:Response regulator transcription factor n=1 Tax=Novilysobacter selenitireducens TaxID=2872639 RepID=A0ABS7T5I3_9GAMM|nr:response regulator transcription factor [Lysobacter selenitireducens]MBZ4039122.1 response regulator transcription factor [Lysobacter selenitireducens]